MSESIGTIAQFNADLEFYGSDEVKEWKERRSAVPTIGAILDETGTIVSITLNGVEVAQLSAEYYRDGSFKGLISQRVKYAVVNHDMPEFPFTTNSLSVGSVSLSSEHVVHEVSLPVLRALSTASGVATD